MAEWWKMYRLIGCWFDSQLFSRCSLQLCNWLSSFLFSQQCARTQTGKEGPNNIKLIWTASVVALAVAKTASRAMIFPIPSARCKLAGIASESFLRLSSIVAANVCNHQTRRLLEGIVASFSDIVIPTAAPPLRLSVHWSQRTSGHFALIELAAGKNVFTCRRSIETGAVESVYPLCHNRHMAMESETISKKGICGFIFVKHTFWG